MAKVGDGRCAAAHAPNTNAETDNRSTCRGTKVRDDVVSSMTRCLPGQRQYYRGVRQGWTALYRRHVPDQQQDSQACGHPANGGGGSIPRTHARPTYRSKTSAVRDHPQGAIHNLAGNTPASHGRWKVRQALPRGLHSEGRKVQQVQGGGCGFCRQHSYNSGSSKEGTSLRAANQLR